MAGEKSARNKAVNVVNKSCTLILCEEEKQTTLTTSTLKTAQAY